MTNVFVSISQRVYIYSLLHYASNSFKMFKAPRYNYLKNPFKKLACPT